MKSLLQFSLFVSLMLMFAPRAAAFNFSQTNHIRVYYDFCEEDIVVEFVYFQSAGDNDRMDYFYLQHQPASGEPVTIIDFRHSSRYNGESFTQLHNSGPATSFGYNFYPSEGHNWQLIHWSLESEQDQEGHKYWVKFILRDLPESTFEMFAASGYWNGQGSNSPDLDINMIYSMNLYTPEAPKQFTASQNKCDTVQFTWVFEDFDSDCVSGGWNYRFELYEGNSTTPFHSMPANSSQTEYLYKRRVPATSTDPEIKNYRIRAVMRKGGVTYQQSPFAGPVAGRPLGLPTPPTNLEVSYPNCSGSVKINWQNEQIYENIVVVLTPTTGPVIQETIAGTSNSHTTTIADNMNYSVVVIGRDICNHQGASAPLAAVRVPDKPGAFDLQSVVGQDGSYLLTWTPAPGATSYRITRSGEGLSEITIDDPEATSYLDSGVKVCTQYSYRVNAINNCGSTASDTIQPPALEESLDVWSTQQLSCSKGYFGNRVEISWSPPDSRGFDEFLLYRTPLSGGASTLVAAINKNELQYTDQQAQAGTLYTYSLIAYSECDGNESESTAITDVGFRLPIAIINGNVKFENGTGVDSVQITVERNAGSLGKGLHFNGQGILGVHPDYFANPIDMLSLNPEMTVEMWVQPNQLNADFTLFEYRNGPDSYGLRYDAANNALVQYVSTASTGALVSYPVNLPTDEFTHISWTRAPGALALFLNGNPRSGSLTPGYASPGGTQSLQFGAGYNGYMDEIRFWHKRRTVTEIRADYKNILSGAEGDLVAYWPANEGVGTGVYDISGREEMFHARHLERNAHVTWVDQFPPGHLLGNRTLTDSVGNYTISHIRYSGVGNTFTVNPFYSPRGTPHEFDPASTVLFLGEGNNVQNGVNFVDKSSFLVTGTIIYNYPDSMCLNTKAFIYIDQQVAQVNGLPATVDPATGTFAIDVPIGLHRLSVQQAGHEFANGGVWPSDGSLFNFQADVSGIEFYDSTTVKVIGRVVGGTREGDKKLGFHESVNNIGQAILTFTAQNGCHVDTVHTSATSGEYQIDLLPFKYDVSIAIPANPAILFPPATIDASIIQPERFFIDTVRNFGGQPIRYDSVGYHIKQNYIYRAIPSVDVVDAETGGPLRGDSLFIFIDPVTRDTTLIPLQGLPYPVFTAGVQYPTIITAFEAYFNYDNLPDIPEDRVPVTDAEVRINNGLGNASGTGQSFEEVFEIRSPDGKTAYTFFGGQPEFTADGDMSLDYTQVFDLQLETPNHTVSWRLPPDLFRGYVLGVKPDVGTSFITEGPEMVDYILRDPPGDKSSAKFISGQSYTDTKSWFLNTALSVGTGTKIKAGQAWFVGGGVVGIGFDTKVENDNNLKINLKTAFNVDGEYTETTTFEQEIATNSDPFFPGDQSDIYLGKSQNFLFGAADELTLVPSSICDEIEGCVGPEVMVNGQSFRLGRRDNLFMVPQGFRTTFVYSQLQITDYLIPDLIQLRNALFTEPGSPYVSYLDGDDPRYGLNNDDPRLDNPTPNPDRTDEADFDGESYKYTVPAGESPNDRVRWYNQQIRLWENAIARNEREKKDALLERNISFDGNASISYTSSQKQTEKHTEKFEVVLNTQTSLAIGGLFAGSGGIFRFTLGLEVATGGTFSQATESTNTYGYTLADAQPGDYFSVDVKNGFRGNGPIFSLRGGQSMCPWEQGYTTEYHQPGTVISESTIRREQPELDVEPSFQNNVPEHQPARFTLKMRNASPTGDIQWYGLRVLEQTNPDAQLRIDGASVNRVFEIPAGETLTKTLELYKGALDEYSVKLMLYSTCEYDGFQNGAAIYASDTITVNAQFVEACSQVRIHQPVDQWIHNVEDGQIVPIQLIDYEIADDNLEYLHLQYKPSFTSVWRSIETLWKSTPPNPEDPQIPPGSTFMTYLWEIEELPDGPYDIRAVSHCAHTDNDYASPAVSGLVDRLRPHAFGNPQPADGVLDPNDEILIQFNEPIDPTSVSVLDFDLRAILNGAPLRHETSILLDGINDYVEVPVGTRIGAHPFSFEVWLKRLSDGQQLIWSQGEKLDSSMAIGFNANNRLFFRWHENTIVSNATIAADGNWHHIAVTCNENSQVNFFHTGEFAGAGVVDTLWSIPGQMVYGKTAWANNFHFNGQLHEARIWRTELTEGAIRTQMLKRMSGSEAGLSVLWPMDEGTGIQLREVVRKKHATLSGDWSIEPSGSSMTFANGFEIEADAGTMVFSHQHHFTIQFWMKGGLTGTTQTILSNGRGDGTDGNDAGWSISLGPAGRMLVFHGGQTFTAIAKNVLDNNWHHVSLVLNRQGNLNTYLDGLLQTSLFGDSFGEFAGAKLWIGNRGWYDQGGMEMHDQPFTGLLDEVRVWNAKMTAELIRATMSNRLAGDEFGLQLYLPFETYEEDNGVPILINSLADGSPFHRQLAVNGPIVYDVEDPGIRLSAPFEKVNFTYSVSGDRILITPTTDPLRLEQTVIHIAVENIRDMAGNNLASPITWTAFVNKNQLQWAEDELYFEKPEKESLEFTVDIVNSGGIDLSYEILGLPDWLTTTQAIGTIAPVSSKTIRFVISPDAQIGDYGVDLNLLSGQGYNDKLSLDLHVFGVPPDWAVNPADYPHSMTIVADLEIRGELSADPLDRIVAYINGEVRGLGTMQYIPELDRHLVFLDVYSNVLSGETVSFKAWDASTGTTYAGVNLRNNNQTNLEIPYVANTLVGNAVAPARFIVTADIIQEIELNAGWTWISFNVVSTKLGDLDGFFEELTFENNDAIYSQTKSSAYNPSSGWQGNLNNDGLEIRKMYKCDFTHADILRVVGPRVNPSLYPITIGTGWNWIPFLSMERIELNEALSSYTATAGDIVKSQDQVAVYHPTQGWVGTLTQMVPGRGYMLYAAAPGSITYPLAAGDEKPFTYVQNVQEKAIQWRSGGMPAVIEGQARNMTMVARLDSDLAIEGMPVIAAMADGVLLDLAEGQRLQGSEDLYYFTLQASGADRMVYFEVYDAAGAYVGLADEKLFWAGDLHLGALAEPYVLHLTAAQEPVFAAYPNPFAETLYLEYEAMQTGPVTIHLYDAQGRVMLSADEYVLRPGLQQWTLRPLREGKPVASGVYTVAIIQGQTIVRRQLVRS